MKIKIFIVIFSLIVTGVFAKDDAIQAAKDINMAVFFDAEKVHGTDYSSLLEEYRNRDNSVEKARLSLEQANNTFNKTKIQNGIDVNLSSGNITIPLTKENSFFEANPSAEIDIPRLNNTVISVDMPFAVGEGVTDFSGSGFDVSTDIISEFSANRKITLLNAQRALENSQRNYEKTVRTVEKKFWQEVQEIYNAALSLWSAENTLHDEETDLIVLQSQGYSPASATYRSKQIKIQTAKNAIFECKQKLDAKLVLFAQNVGSDTLVIPIGIPSEDLCSYEDFDKNSFITLEEADWHNTLTEMERDAKKQFTLAATGGYHFFENRNALHPGKEHTVDVGVNATYKGFNLGLGFSMPVNRMEKSGASLSLGWEMSKMFGEKYDFANADLQVDISKITVKDALSTYETTLTERQQKRNSLLAKIDMQIEQLKVFYDYMNESENWFKRGLITEKQLLQARRDWQNAVASVVACRIEGIIYNLETADYFLPQSGKVE
ncbi:MAG: hypothetical protein IIW10_04910 [Spirochaetaceae bacterium]|nr:hypothetical protein [Spirochaetaceae bacterium]